MAAARKCGLGRKKTRDAAAARWRITRGDVFTESEERTGSNTVTVPGATSHPSLDEISYTYAVTDEIRETLYREVFGRRLNTLQPVYQQPTDDDEMQVMSFPNSNYTPPPESFVAPSEFF